MPQIPGYVGALMGLDPNGGTNQNWWNQGPQHGGGESGSYVLLQLEETTRKKGQTPTHNSFDPLSGDAEEQDDDIKEREEDGELELQYAEETMKPKQA